jgi:CBS domain-containing protein
VLAAFNLVPGFPLDGGRILRAIIWRASGSLERATRIAAAAGQVVGAALIGIGVVQTLVNQEPAALWLAFIGWMVYRSARGSAQHQALRRILSRGVVGEAMRPPPSAIPAAMSLSDALDRHLRGHETEVFPVVEEERIVGLLTFDAAARIGRDDPLRPVGEAMLPLQTAVTVSVGDRLDEAMDRLDGREGMVLADGRLVGTISAVDVERWLRRT